MALLLTELRSTFAASLVGLARAPTTATASVEMRGHRSKVHSLDWNGDGSRLASGSTDHSIRIWNMEQLLVGSLSEQGGSVPSGGNNPPPLHSSTALRGHGGAVDQVAWCPGSTSLLASVGADKSLMLWDTRASPDPVATTVFASDQINLAWRGDLLLATAGKDDALSLVDVRMGSSEDHALRARQQRKFSGEINEMAWLPSEPNDERSRLLLTRGSGTIEVIDAGDAELSTLQTLAGHTSNAYCIQTTPDGRHFAVGAADALVSIWETDTLICVGTVNRLDWPVRSLAYSHDGSLLAAASEDPFIDISFHPTPGSALEEGLLVAKLPVSAPINALAWHPQRCTLAYAGDHVDSRTGRSTGSIYLHSIQQQ